MKNEVLVVMSIICVLCACNSTEDLQKEFTILLESSAIEVPENVSSSDYYEYNNDSLNIGSINLFSHITEADIYIYAEQVKGIYIPISNKEGIFPIHLISALEEALYNSNNMSTQNFMEDILNSPYFDTIRTLGADDYQLNLEEVYQLFPEVHEHKSEIDNIHQAYRFINTPPNCIEIFHIDEVGSDGELYVFVYGSGGTNGVNSVSIIKKNNEEFTDLCKFETQNNGHGRVISYGESYYYIFLEYNYNLKNYDSMRIHKLGVNADTENVQIKYLPEKYIWKNIYEEPIESSLNINNYIESIREIISSGRYIESGSTDTAQIFWGDEREDHDFPLADDYNQYYKADLTNSGIPIYFRKSDHVPSNYQSTWHLKAKFYTYDTQTDSVMELEKLEIGEQLPLKNEMVQMWFKEIDNKVFTFTIHHISDYNYMLNVLLIGDEAIEVVRTDIFSPQRKFVLSEGIVFKSY